MLEQGTVVECGVCAKSSLELLWDLPKLPLTEKFGPYDPAEQLYANQQLLICNHCGHVQLGTQIAPKLLYTPSEYSFRTSQSNTARSGTQLFFDFYNRVGHGRTFHSLLDIGGNDLFLAKIVQLKERCVVDPICAPQDGQIIEGVKIIGRFIEQINCQKEGMLPDLIFCRHVLEHIPNPRKLFIKLFNECHAEALYIFEIPCFANLMEANRFDAIFHQHYHYFDLPAFQRLIAEVGGQYLAHAYHHQGSCGGSLLIAFQRRNAPSVPLAPLNMKQRKKQIKKAIQHYRDQMQLLSAQLQKFHKQIYGYGASLMLATLGYHLKTDFSELICILDDDPLKDLTGYQNVPVKVRFSGVYHPEPNSNYLITSLENSRCIFKKIMDLSPRRVLTPLVS